MGNKDVEADAVVEAGEVPVTELIPPSLEVAQLNSNDDEAIYNRFTGRRKAFFCVILALCGILVPVASTSCLTAVPEIATTFHSTGSIINTSNGAFTGAMGIAAYFWGALSTLVGRRFVLFSSVATFFLFSLGCALAPNLASFFVFRTLSGFSGTGLLICGPGMIGDLYKPTERATGLSWIMSGTLIGPALGPLIGGIIVTYRDWRDIYWFQTALAGLAAALAFAFMPETIHTKRWDSIPQEKRVHEIAKSLNPWRLLVLFSTPNLLLVALASSSLLWNMYAFITPIVYVINPRLHFTTPLQSGLFYLAPGCGYLVGTFFGGKWADYTVKKWIRKRNGERRPEDRLRSVLPWMGLGTPICMLIYGWCLEYNRGGIALMVIVMFIQGFTQLMIFPGLNTYCLDIMPSRSLEVMGGNYLIRYAFGAAGTSLVLPAIDGIGIGWFCTLSVAFIEVTCAGLLLVIYDKVPRRRKAPKTEKDNTGGEKA